MAKKAPRRTAQRILEVTLDLFNRFGEPNVSTTAISAELGISPGNLYYHYPAKDALINTLFDQYEEALNGLLRASDSVHNVEDAWFFLHTLFELIWEYRFLYRDLNDLLSKPPPGNPFPGRAAPQGKGSAHHAGRHAASTGAAARPETRAARPPPPPAWWWC
jgi:AcrR family transcriptional regulator